MTLFSKPLYNALALYLSNLYTNPIRTKAITSCVLTATANLAAQLISGPKTINQESVLAYALFGFLFGGTVPLYYYKSLEHIIPQETSLLIFKKLFVDRLIFMPLYQAFSLYMLARFEKKSHDEALAEFKKTYWPILSSSLKYLTILQLVNITLVPPMLRVLSMNMISFFWVIYVANYRRRQQAKENDP